MRLPSEQDFSSRLRSPAVSSRVGVWLGVCFAVAFLTGLISHASQVTDQVIPFPASPSWGYRVTQGLHVTAGTAAVPLLLVKLWTVFHRLFTRPPRAARALLLHALERVSIGVLVASAIFMLVTGLANAAQWYPWSFSFRSTHYAIAWVAIGSLVIHVAVQLPVIRKALGEDVDSTDQDRDGGGAGGVGGGGSPTGEEPAEAGRTSSRGVLTRRGLLRSTWLATGVAVLATAGSTVPALRRISVFGVRSGDGPAGIPINKSAKSADVLGSATSSSYRLTVVNGDREVVLSRADLLAMPQRREELPIACVEGWSASGTWGGVRVRDLLDLVDAPAGSDVKVDSLQESGPFRSSLLQGNFADHPLTLLAVELEGEPLAIDHGYPCRIIAPNRPGVLQTKWVDRLEVV
ncbi:molybdopterin-dependent oxidoreductase [Nocardioides donggukensis]|uniref:Molybdopterin-dependent oxidoreductase n=1 Tax=Nocardioides donggukensis TaxID=2774019 RepID=A0A927Q197_9ACTN|nr:molybdopterin-dependent oxidoreductase [Nocardioides donggukensis]MBD8869822.1 molybdopterin-dependent oxidoreductase [Nocardioides donggukensis]